jgi:hypothetical protein
VTDTALYLEDVRNGRMSILAGEGPELEPVRLTTVLLLGLGTAAGLTIAAVGLTTAVPQQAAGYWDYWLLGLAVVLTVAGGAGTAVLAMLRRRQLFLAHVAADGLADLARFVEEEPVARMQALGGEQWAQEILGRATRLRDRLVNAGALSEARALGSSIFRFHTALSTSSGSDLADDEPNG